MLALTTLCLTTLSAISFQQKKLALIA